jgi:hypothetical protein
MDTFANDAAQKFMSSEVPHITNFPTHEIAVSPLMWKGEKITLEDMPAEAMEFVGFRRAMDMMRKSFIPPNGAGSQTLAYDLHADVAQLVVEKCKKEMAFFDEPEEDNKPGFPS